MNKVAETRSLESDKTVTRDWSKAISDHVAYALLTYTGLTVMVTITALRTGAHTVLPYLSLIVLILAIIPACRWFEKRWTGLDEEAACNPELAGQFRRDIILLWLLALTLPLGLTALFKALPLPFMLEQLAATFSMDIQSPEWMKLPS